MYCSDDRNCILNYQNAINDGNNMWELHHILESHTSDGWLRPVFISRKELKALGMYYKRPSNEFILLTKKDHFNIHSMGRYFSKFNRISKQKSKSKTKRNRCNKQYCVGKMVKCLELNLVFNSISEAAREFDVEKCNIRIALKKGGKCQKCHWEYID